MHEKDFASYHTAAGWAGWAIAEIVGIRMSKQGKKAPEGYAPVLRLQENLIRGGQLATRQLADSRSGRERSVLVVGEWVEVDGGDESVSGFEDPQVEGSNEKGAAPEAAAEKRRSRRKSKPSSGRKPAKN